MIRLPSRLVLLCGLAPACIHAQPVPPQEPSAAGWHAAIDIGARHLLVREYLPDGRKLVDERGWLPGLEAAVGYGHGDWRLTLSGATYRHDIDYRGQLQRGASFATDTGTAQHRVGAAVAYAWNPRLQLQAALEWDRWQRHIDGRGAALGLRERYTSMRMLAGVGTRLWHGAPADVGFDAALVFARPERLRVRFDRQWFDDAHLETRRATGLRTALTARPSALPQLALTVEADWLRVDRSADVPLYRDGMPAGTVAQPEHDRRAIGIRAGYRF